MYQLRKTPGVSRELRGEQQRGREKVTQAGQTHGQSASPPPASQGLWCVPSAFGIKPKNLSRGHNHLPPWLGEHAVTHPAPPALSGNPHLGPQRGPGPWGGPRSLKAWRPSPKSGSLGGLRRHRVPNVYSALVRKNEIIIKKERIRESPQRLLFLREPL